jgi:hypothetical protein
VRYAEEHRDGWSNFMDRLAGLVANGFSSRHP